MGQKNPILGIKEVKEAKESEENRKTIIETPPKKVPIVEIELEPTYVEEGEMSAFMELQCQDEEKPLGSGFVEEYLNQRRESQYKKSLEKKKEPDIDDDNLLAADDYLKDLLDLDDSNLMDNFENINIENIMLEGEDLQVDLNMSLIEVPDYLAEKQQSRPSNKFTPKNKKFIDNLSTLIVTTTHKALEFPEEVHVEEYTEEEISSHSSVSSSSDGEEDFEKNFMDISKRSV